MKQHITEEQLNELNDKQKDIWTRWMVSKGYYSGNYKARDYLIDGFPTIGQMIEFLEEHDSDKCDFAIHCWQEYAGDSKELADYLWGGVKEVLSE
jgi:hypothetical protein